MNFDRKYATGTGADIIIPIPKADSSDFAIAADWTPAIGDVKISKDGGAAANIGTLPVFVTNIGWKFVFTNEELTAKRINVNVVDAATKVIKDQHLIIETYGHASAMHPFDKSNPINAAAGIVESNLKQINGNASKVTALATAINTDSNTVASDLKRIKSLAATVNNLEKDYDGSGYDKMSNFNGGKVYYNSLKGTAGTTFPTGTAKQPAADIMDARTIANARNLSEIMCNMEGGNATLSAAFEGKKLIGVSGWGSDAGVISLGGQAHARNIFKHLSITGNVDGYYNKFIECLMQDFKILTGNDDIFLLMCNIIGSLWPTGDHTLISKSFFGYDSTLLNDFVTVVCDVLSTDSKIFNIIDCAGKIKITSLTAAGAGINLYGFKGEIIIDSTCNNGTINIKGGGGKITQGQTGSCVVNVNGFDYGLTQQEIRDSMKLTPSTGDPGIGSADTEEWDGVYFEDLTGYTGTAYPIGRKTKPSDNMNDAGNIMSGNNINTMFIRLPGGSTVTPARSNSRFIGDYTYKGLVSIYGAGGGTFNYWEGLKIRMYYDNGKSYFYKCLFSQDLYTTDSDNIFDNCILDCANGIRPYTAWFFKTCYFKSGDFNMQDNGSHILKNCRGRLVIKNMAGGILNIHNFRGEIDIQATCTGGTINLFSGGGKLTDNSGGGCTVNNEGFDTCAIVSQQEIRDSMKLAPTAGAPAAGSVDKHLDDIEADTNETQTKLPATTIAAAGDKMDVIDELKHKAGSSGYNRVTDSFEAIGEKAQDIIAKSVLKDVLFNRNVLTRHPAGPGEDKPKTIAVGAGGAEGTVTTTIDGNGNLQQETIA